MTVLWLGEEDCHTVTKVGGKAANLSRLAADYRVPPGFCIAPEIHDQIMNGALTSYFGTCPDDIPAILQNLVTKAYRQLGVQCSSSEPSVAVRSSAVDEDGHSSSFAGQYDTYLNIIGAEEVSRAIMRCWSSADGERMQSYRQKNNLDGASSGIAVLVQQLIPANSSGVVFSANPISGNQNEVMINASWGLGESVVSGTVTPDTLVVSKEDFSLVDSFIGPKSRMTVLSDIGTTEIDVPSAQQNLKCMDDEQIREVSELAVNLESRMGWPVDLEFAYQGESLFLLQCRPITPI